MSDELDLSQLARLFNPRDRAVEPDWSTPTALWHTLTGEAPIAHTKKIDEYVLAQEAGDARYLMIFMPPRYSKTSIAGKATGMWRLKRNPDTRLMYASYAATLASRISEDMRNKILEHARWFGFDLAADSQAKAEWRIKGRLGGMLAGGVGGPFTGFPADHIHVDDPLKNAEEANSLTIRDNQWDWWNTTLWTRREPGCTVTLCLTRWHEDDLAGRLLNSKGAGKWTVLNLPALAEENDLLGRKVGDPLWPQRFSKDEVEEERDRLGGHLSQTWNSLYQQRPTPLGGGFFRRKTFSYWHEVNANSGPLWKLGERYIKPDDCYRYATCDTAHTANAGSDWSVIAAWALTPEGDLILLDVERQKMVDGDLANWMLRFTQRHRPSFVAVEGTFATSGLAGRLAQATTVPFKWLKPENSKAWRAQEAQLRLEQGRIWWKADAPWLEAWERELLSFRPVDKNNRSTGGNDDQVDVLAYAAQLADLTLGSGGGWDSRPTGIEGMRMRTQKPQRHGMRVVS